MTRQEYVQWCKDRALAYFNQGDLNNAFASMVSDMSKREDTQYPAFLNQLGMMELMHHNRDGVKRWIEGFN